MQRLLGSSSRVQIPEARSIGSRMNETTELPMYRRYSGEGRKTSSRCSPEKMLHLIPVVVLLCFFILSCFSYPVNLEMKDGRIIGATRATTQTNLIFHLLSNYQPSSSSSASIVSQMQTVAKDTVQYSNANA